MTRHFGLGSACLPGLHVERWTFITLALALPVSQLAACETPSYVRVQNLVGACDAGICSQTNQDAGAVASKEDGGAGHPAADSGQAPDSGPSADSGQAETSGQADASVVGLVSSDAAGDGAGNVNPADGAVEHCSLAGGPKVTLTVQNLLVDQTVSVLWVNLMCNEMEYSRIAPGATYRVNTFGAHTWRIRDLSGTLIKEIAVASTPATQQVSVP